MRAVLLSKFGPSQAFSPAGAECRHALEQRRATASATKQSSPSRRHALLRRTTIRPDGPAASDAPVARTKRASAHDRSALSEVVPGERPRRLVGDDRIRRESNSASVHRRRPADKRGKARRDERATHAGRVPPGRLSACSASSSAPAAASCSRLAR